MTKIKFAIAAAPTIAAELIAARRKLEAVQGLVDALARAIEVIDAAYDGPDDNGAYSVRERTALAAWEAAQ